MPQIRPDQLLLKFTEFDSPFCNLKPSAVPGPPSIPTQTVLSQLFVILTWFAQAAAKNTAKQMKDDFISACSDF